MGSTRESNPRRTDVSANSQLAQSMAVFAANRTHCHSSMQIYPSVDEIKARWKQQMNEARKCWCEISEIELMNIEGHKPKLISLIQERYGITRYEAEKQVKTFFEKSAR